jgi:predicted  nucleic acid-binding Zn-ribbon protein
MSNLATTPDAFPHRGTSAPSRVAICLSLAAVAGTLWWGVGTNRLSFPGETPTTLEDRVAALTEELAEVKAGTAELRDSQGDTAEELSHIRTSLANAEIGLAALRTTTNLNEARRRDSATQIESNLARLRDETLRLREAQDFTTGQMSSLRSTTSDISQQVDRMEAIRDATGSIGKSHKHPVRRKWVAQP